MLEVIRHRGDKPPAIEIRGRNAIGCNRLAIVDSTNGGQPMASDDGKLLAVLNGEIYNHVALRQELQSKHRFCTSCDTEVLINAFREWGEDFASHLDGIFAFVILDVETGRFAAGRDRFGVKPLYQLRNRGAVYLASEVKCLTMLRGQTQSASVEAVTPGHVLSANSDRKYTDIWSAPAVPASFDRDRCSSLVDDLLSRLDAAVAKRVATKLPVGVLVGGGVDSSLILELARRHHKELVAFAAGLPGCEDIACAQLICRHLDIPLIEVVTSPTELKGLIPRVVEHAESFEPNVIRNAVFTYLAAERAHEKGFKIALCGEGADELFLGYPELVMAAKLGETRLTKVQTLFLEQLNRTQLQRVDRMGMAHALEVRVPYLDSAVVAFAAELPPSALVQDGDDKWLLRMAASRVLPSTIAYRRKAPISEGAGAGGNGKSQGFFFDHACKVVNDREEKDCCEAYPDFHLASKEEVLYFKEFVRHGYDVLAESRTRVTANAT